MKQLAPGIIVLDNGLHYFSAERVLKALEVVVDGPTANETVSSLISTALTAEFKAVPS